MDGGSGKRDRQKYEIYMEATMLDRIADANYRASSELNIMQAEVTSESEKHHALTKEMKASHPVIPQISLSHASIHSGRTSQILLHRLTFFTA